MNREPEIWGPDAHEFKPERWIDGLPETASKGMEVPFAHIATFIAGPRGAPPTVPFRRSALETDIGFSSPVKAACEPCFQRACPPRLD